LVSGSTEIGSPYAQGGGNPCICLLLLGLVTGGGGGMWAWVSVLLGMDRVATAAAGPTAVGLTDLPEL
jgi:hypothetical protein